MGCCTDLSEITPITQVFCLYGAEKMATKNVKVSVIVPVYNVAPYLARCLDSLVGQTLHDIEIICIDDKSTDNSLEILRRYAKQDKRVRVIALEQNSGVSTARNAGIDAARGEYLGFVDSDDFVDTDFYEKLYMAAHAADADMARCGYKETLTNGKTTTYDGIVYDVQAKGKWACMHQAWCAIYRTKMMRQNKIKFPTHINYAEDLLFLTQAVAEANDVVGITGTYYHYVRRNDSLDAPVLSTKHISDLIVSCHEIADIYNANRTISDCDYVSCYAVLIKRLQMHFLRTVSMPARQDMCSAMVGLFKKCHAPLVMLQMLFGFGLSRQVLQCLRAQDETGLYDCLSNEYKTQQDVFYLFGLIPACRMIRTVDRFIVRVFGIQVLKVKPVSTDYRVWVLYIPIVRKKRK